MTPKEFPEVNVRIAEGQEEYITLPAYYDNKEGSILYCMVLDEAEKKKIAETGEIWLKQLTYGSPMQPIALSIIKEELGQKF